MLEILPSEKVEQRQLPPHMQNENADFWLTEDELREICKMASEQMNKRWLYMIPTVFVLATVATLCAHTAPHLLMSYFILGLVLPLTMAYEAFVCATANQPLHARHVTALARRVCPFFLPFGPLFMGVCSHIDSIAHANQGKFIDSQVSLAECAAVFGADAQPKELSLMTAMANVYSRAGRFDLAEPLYQDCLKRSKGWTVGQFDRAIALNNIGWVHLLTGKHELAKEALEEAIRMTNSHRTSNPSGRFADFIMCIDLNYARTLIRLGEFDKAEKILHDTFNKSTRRFRHVETTMAEAQLGFAELRFCQNRLDEAMIHVESAVQACKSVGGSGNVLHRYARRLQAEILKDVGREEESQRIEFECDFEVASMEADNLQRANEVRALLMRRLAAAAG